MAAKRPRLGLRKLATTVHQGFTQARQKLRKLRRGRRTPGHLVDRLDDDPVEGEGGGRGPAFGLECTNLGDEDWWREGVSKYEAPSWLDFGGGSGREPTVSRTTAIHHF
jgi:hypothetical protein